MPRKPPRQLHPKEPFLLQDRVLLSALMFGSSGYIVIKAWYGIMLLVASFMMAAIWSFRTAGTSPNRNLRLMAVLLMVTLGSFMTVYISAREGILR